MTLSPRQITEKVCRRDMLAFVSREELRNFHQTSVTRSLVSIAAIWISILGTLLVSFLAHTKSAHGFYALAPFAALFIATRFHALSVQVHEAAHYSFDRSRRSLNDLIGNWLVGYWILFDVSLYRCAHEAHHRYLDTAGDPDLDFYNFPAADHSFFVKLILKDLFLWTAVERIWLILSGKRSRQIAPGPQNNLSAVNVHLFAKGFVQAIVLGSFVALLGMPRSLIFWFVLWFIPLFSFFPLIVRWRTIAEHWHPQEKNSGRRFVARSFSGRPLDIWIIGAQMRFHMEHHLYPAIPFHQLNALHGLLEKRGFFDPKVEGNHADLGMPGYLPVWRELLSPAIVVPCAGAVTNVPLK